MTIIAKLNPFKRLIELEKQQRESDKRILKMLDDLKEKTQKSLRGM